MNSRTYLALFLIAASIAIGTTTSIATQASAEKPDLTGLDRADKNIHDNTPGGFGGQQDVRHHEGTCQGGHDFSAPEIPLGCDDPRITDPGNSEHP